MQRPWAVDQWEDRLTNHDRTHLKQVSVRTPISNFGKAERQVRGSVRIGVFGCLARGWLARYVDSCTENEFFGYVRTTAWDSVNVSIDFAG